jgi:ABC-2 type transport system ATP-binding protein
MEDLVISTKDLVKQFKINGKTRAVDGVTLQVQRGEVFGLIGPDGAGKTTLTRVILGLLSRTDGESSILGYDPMKHPFEVRERVGYVAQQFTLPPELTVMENMVFFADSTGVPRKEQKRRILELLSFTGLTQFTDRQTRRLSGGMKKKLALSCSLIHDPNVLLLDEPTLGVDPVSRREFWSLLSALRSERGMTILVCTPYMDEAERCNRVGLMYKGKIIANDTPERIKAMTPGELLEFTPDPDAFDEASALVAQMNGVIEVQTFGAMLHVFVDQAQTRQPEMEHLLAERNIRWSNMRQIEPRMEEAFINLIQRQQNATRDGAK